MLIKFGGIEIYDVIVIGTGAGGATVAKDLSLNGRNVLILDKGRKQSDGNYVKYMKNKEIHLKNNLSNEDKQKYEFLTWPLTLTNIEEVGGTTTSSIGNACFSCSGCYTNSIMQQFEDKNLDIFEELLEASGELNVRYFPKKSWGHATKLIADAGNNLGYVVEPMPKFINFEKCRFCGKCVNGCMFDAKWDATYFIKEAQEYGAKLITGLNVIEILHEKGQVAGVVGINENNEKQIFKAKKVVVAAGALNTPIILKNSRIKNVGGQIFFDIFTTIGGYLKDANLKNELMMGIKAEFGPYFLSPHYSMQLLPLMKEKGIKANESDVIGIMLKFADTCIGTIDNNGNIEKTLTKVDADLIKEGYEKAVKILLKLGVDERSIVATSLKGAHPGGTAAVGEVVDNNFETEIKGLYVSDASVIPEAPGRPPILTIVAIAKKVAKIVNSNI
ncbi:GMC family oxidoreductase N-terminal domain-containing protein [Methanobrevibacter sp.]|uniref:GMC family oxidoreductase N-terminal domain-containing protein n=1 Tax=Methanobrevibacter sp. TaxID=66852 RepID=UPI003890C1F9